MLGSSRKSDSKILFKKKLEKVFEIFWIGLSQSAISIFRQTASLILMKKIPGFALNLIV
jgi:hypothetical protein